MSTSNRADAPAAHSGRAGRRGTVTSFVTGFVRGGLLDGGRGVAGAPSGAFLPGRRSIPRTDRASVETRTVNGQQATDRAGAAEYLGMPPNTVRMYSSPSRRSTTGFPAPLPDRQSGRDWFALTDLAAYKQQREATPDVPFVAGDPSELIDATAFAGLRGVEPDTMHGYVKRSLAAWERGEDGYLPRPDQSEPARHGHTHRWTRARAVAWIFPAAPRRSTGRPPAARTATVADLTAVLDDAADRVLTNRDIAAALSERLGAVVSTQTVQRLRRKVRQATADASTPTS